MRRIASLVLLLAALLAPSLAHAQSSPGLIYGQVPTAAQWNSYFSSKQDYLGAAPCLVTGCTMTGKLVTAAPTAAAAGLNLNCGTTPTSPVTGDLWCTVSGIYVQINGATVGPLGTGGGGTTLTVGSTPTSGAPTNGILFNAAGNVLGASTTLPTALTYPNVVLTGLPTGAGSIITINGTNCQLGTACPVPSGPLAIGSTNITGAGAIPNGILYNSGGVPNVIGNLATCVSGVVGTNGSGVPSCSSTLPSGIAATNMALTTPSLGVATATKLTITSASANAFAVGLNGATNPALNVDASTSSSATGLNIKSAAAAGGLALSVISTAGAENLTINALGTGTIGIGSVSTGIVTITPATTITGALTLSGGLSAPLNLANGGTNNTLTASNGGIVYSDGTKLNILAGTATALQCLVSGSNSAPQWYSCSGAAASVSSVADNGGGTMSISPTTGSVTVGLNLANNNTWTGAQSYANGKLILSGSTSGAMTLEAPAIAGSYVMTFPAATDTVAVLGTPQVFTAAESIESGNLRILNTNYPTNTGYTSLASANTGNTNYTLTLPAVSSTVAVLGSANQIFTATETFSGTLNVTGVFQVGGNAMTFPGTPQTLASLGTAEGFTAPQTGQIYASGYVNKFRDGTLDVFQRGTSALATATAARGVYTADGWRVQQTGAAFTCAQDTGNNGPLYSLKCVGGAANTDTLFIQPIESYVAAPLAGQTVTVQFQYKQTSGSSITPKVSTCYASSQDVFSTCTGDLSATSITSCATATWCTESYTFAVSASAVNGYQVTFDCNTALTAAQACWITAADIRVTPGVATGVNANPPPPELRPIAGELAFCQRYYQKVGGSAYEDITAYGYGVTNDYYTTVIGIPAMRTVPTATIVGSWGSVNTSSIVPSPGQTTLTLYAQIASTGQAVFYTTGTSTYVTLDAEL